MKKVKVDKKRRESLAANFKALAFLSLFLLPFSLGGGKKLVRAETTEKNAAIWG